MHHLKRVNKFLTHNISQEFTQSSMQTVTAILGNLMLLADSCIGSMPLALTFGTRRKNIMSVLAFHIEVFLRGHYGHLEGDPSRLALLQYCREQAQQLSKEAQSKRKDRLIHRAKAQLPISIGPALPNGIDAVDLEVMGNIVGRVGEREAWVQKDHAAQMGPDLAHSKEQ